MTKNVKFGSDNRILDAKMNPFNNFGLDVFTYLKYICLQIKEKITGKTASGFLLFGKIQGQKSQFMNPAVCFRPNILNKLLYPLKSDEFFCCKQLLKSPKIICHNLISVYTSYFQIPLKSCFALVVGNNDNWFSLRQVK